MELTNEHLTRQLEIIPMDTLGMPVHIIGCGAIGSFAALSLAKMGVTNLYLYDFDEVSVENMNNQFYRFKDIGKKKSAALSDLIGSFTGVYPWYTTSKVDEHTAGSFKGILVVAVDTMEARRMVYESIKDKNFGVKYIVDPRMGAEFFTMYVMNPHNGKDQETYDKTLFSDADAAPVRCTAKSTIYTATLASGMVTKAIKNILVREKYPRTTQWDIKASKDPMNMWEG